MELEKGIQAKKIILLGATGSIGKSTLEIIQHYPEYFQLVGISADTKSEQLLEISERFKVPALALTDEPAYQSIRTKLSSDKTLYGGDKALSDLIEATEADLLVVAIVGACGLEPTIKAIEKGMDIALANKELLVLGGPFVTRAVTKAKVQLLPIDSEHNAIFQCLQGYDRRDLKSIVLTASGGACRELPIDQLISVTPEQAQKHPNWSMGAKITIDSATMANKGLELIEARWLFDLPSDQLKVIVHPESIVHSFVEWIDGSVLAQLTPPSMTFAIQHCLFYPEKRPSPQASIDFHQSFSLNFQPPDLKRYPCLELAYHALENEPQGGAIYNAANEIAVQRFLQGAIRFTDIPYLIERALDESPTNAIHNLESLIQLDRETRHRAAEMAPQKTV